MESKLQNLLQYCTHNNRVCPKPLPWNRLWELLPNKHRKGCGWNPPLPLILGAWWETSDIQKAMRLREHIMWAYEHGAFEIIDQEIRGVVEEEWHHFGE